MSHFISKTAHILFKVFCVLYIICVALSGPSVIFSNDKRFILAVLLLLGCLLYLFFGSTIIEFCKNKLGQPLQKLSTLQMMVIIGATALITKLFFVLLLQNDANLHPDMQRYLSFANQIARDGEITEYAWYAYRHKRTAVFGLILSPFALLFGESTQALTAGITLMLAISSVLLFDILRKYAGKSLSFVGIMVYNLMPFGLFQSQLLVHETPLLFFHILSLWLLLKAREKRTVPWLKLILIILSAVSIGIGKNINPAGSVVVISLAIISFIDIIKDKITGKKLLKFTCFLLIFVLSVSATGSMLTATVDTMIPPDSHSEQIREKTLSYGWTLYVALSYDSHGGWNKDDYDTYYHYENIENIDEAKEYQRNLLKERINEYVEDPIKIPLLFIKKFYALWGDFWLTINCRQGNHIEQFLCTGMHSMISVALWMTTCLCYLIVLTTILFARKKNRSSNDLHCATPGTHCRMVVLGVTVALMFSEVMPKYVSHLILLVFAIWILSMKDFYNTSALIRDAFFKRHTHKLQNANEDT